MKRPRFSIRWLMALVALVAILLVCFAVPLWRYWSAPIRMIVHRVVLPAGRPSLPVKTIYDMRRPEGVAAFEADRASQLARGHVYHIERLSEAEADGMVVEWKPARVIKPDPPEPR